MRREDTEQLLGIFSDPVLMAGFGTEPFDRTRMEQWVERNLSHQARHGYGLYSVILRSGGRLIGDCGLERMELAGESIVELGYDIRRDCWGWGYATEAATAVRDEAVARLGITRLVSLIRAGNVASRRVAEKIGMRPVMEILRHGHPYAVYELRHGDTQEDRTTSPPP